ncbi:hypothetical protein C451_05208 [Halococcus thailandensis JCM 13552]|uniref:Uncharacterized protein n=1 Tax=Halococcus thailandensis JCM 13552 TaxID=1227457 RepID=M0NCW4_9EURY|nr:hypothetical protein C451_05208 [Halococcus thailandensis JCM 13552]
MIDSLQKPHSRPIKTILFVLRRDTFRTLHQMEKKKHRGKIWKGLTKESFYSRMENFNSNTLLIDPVAVG